ncbi:uncharacterized protein LOC131319499 isoform X3 [Rhododendron vialii]|uniref:uncharacterized protein LOC131319499 isoform X3 n=1 Tax=Rhododendron vialii TaxID=182163 RepID=UPI00265DB9B2|nr:uncharacterized protein LOC131319499 isoform X3 [Rhododendron vialii]
MRGAVGGGGRRGMFGTVQRAVKTGVVGGATDDYDNASTTSTTSSTTPKPTCVINRLSLSSSYGPPISPTWHPSCSSPTCWDEFEWVYVDGAEDETSSSYGFNDDFVFRPVPSKDEVQNAVLSIQQVLDPTSFSKFIKGRLPYNSDNDVAEEIASPRMNRVSSVGQELDWIEPSFHLCNPRMLQYRGCDRVYNAFHLLHTDPSIQMMVMSLSSDKAVWDAVLNNEVVRELRESLIKGFDSVPENQSDRSDVFNAAADILNWIFNNTKAEVLKLMEKITKLVNGLFQSREDETTGGATEPIEGKLQTSLMLTIVVLLIVVVTRTSMARPP